MHAERELKASRLMMTLGDTESSVYLAGNANDCRSLEALGKRVLQRGSYHRRGRLGPRHSSHHRGLSRTCRLPQAGASDSTGSAPVGHTEGAVTGQQLFFGWEHVQGF